MIFLQTWNLPCQDASAQVEDHARVLASGQGLSPNYTFYLASPDFVKKNPKAVKSIIQQINVADKWVQANRTATAQAIGQSTGLKPQVSQVFIERRPKPSGAAPLSAKSFPISNNWQTVLLN